MGYQLPQRKKKKKKNAYKQIIKVNKKLISLTLGDHSGRGSAPAGLVLLEGPSDCGGGACQSGGLTFI